MTKFLSRYHHILFTIWGTAVLAVFAVVAPSYSLMFLLGVCVGTLIAQIAHEAIFG